jgi:CRISPR/Cas system-associated exonuclease Cas4 (RecB family)
MFFFTCKTKSLLKDIFELDRYDLDAALLDDKGKGLLNHFILGDLFTMIKDEDGRFDKSHIAKYYEWTDNAALRAAQNYPAFRGPLARPLLDAMALSLSQKIKKMLDTEAGMFDLCYVDELERAYALELKHGAKNIMLNGRLDRASLSPDKQSALIIDYKTGPPPSRTESSENENSPISDFQMAVYIKLYEAEKQKKVSNGFYFSINSNSLKKIVWDGYKHGSTDYSREAFEPTLEALETYIDDYADAIEALDFSPKPIPYRECYSCEYKNICRTTFANGGA